MKKAYVILAPGFEILEATAPVDVLERCGITVEKVAANGKDPDGEWREEELLVPSSHFVYLMADSILSSESDVDRILSDADMVILPGGFPGYQNLAQNSLVGKLLAGMESNGKLIAAICGAPSALAGFHIAEGSIITCHSSVKDVVMELRNGLPAYRYTGNATETDGNIITGRGAGVSIEFAFACAAALADEKVIAEVRRKMEISQ